MRARYKSLFRGHFAVVLTALTFCGISTAGFAGTGADAASSATQGTNALDDLVNRAQQAQALRAARQVKSQECPMTLMAREEIVRRLRDPALAIGNGPFKDFFTEASQRVYEREDVLKLMQLSLISKEHLLLVGPPGNAKSEVISTVYSNIVDDQDHSSYFKIQLTKETTTSDTHGSINYRVLNEEGKVVRNYDEGILGAHLAFLDETFDVSANALRNTLDVLAERAHGQSGRIHRGKTWSVAAASNRYISQIYEEFGGSNKPQALMDRIAFVTFVSPDFARVGSVDALSERSRYLPPMPVLTFSEIEVLQKMAEQVKIPRHIARFMYRMVFELRPEVAALEEASRVEYEQRISNGETSLPPWRATKYQSIRTYGKALNILRAIVAMNWLKNQERQEDDLEGLTANLDDVRELESFFSLNGPSDAALSAAISRASDRHEREQYETIRRERELFRNKYTALNNGFNQAIARLPLTDVASQVERFASLSQKEKSALLIRLRNYYQFSMLEGPNEDSSTNDMTAERIAYGSLVDVVHDWLVQLGGTEQANELISEWQAAMASSDQRDAARVRVADWLAQETRSAVTVTAPTPPVQQPQQNTPASTSPATSPARLLEILRQQAQGVNAPLASFNPKIESFEFARFEPGTFMIGSPDNEPGRYSDEGPQQRVEIQTAFEMGNHVPQWMLMIWRMKTGRMADGNNLIIPHFRGRDHSDGDFLDLQQRIRVGGQDHDLTINGDHPAEMVSQEEGLAFVEWLNSLPEIQATGCRYDLPTQAQWQYAARYLGPGRISQDARPIPEAQLGQFAYYSANSGNRTHAIGQHPPFPNGLREMFGNVWVWTKDHFDSNNSSDLPRGVDPIITRGSKRVIVGGGWHSDAGLLRSAIRYGNVPGDRDQDLGLRLVRTCR